MQAMSADVEKMELQLEDLQVGPPSSILSAAGSTFALMGMRKHSTVLWRRQQ